MSGYKIVDLNEDMRMTAEMERAVERAYSLDDSRTTIQVPRKEHLDAEHIPGISCNHDWITVNLAVADDSKDWKKFLQELFDEMDLGDVQAMCTRCKAFALFDKDGGLWAYDASETLPKEQPRKEKSGGRDNKRQWRK